MTPTDKLLPCPFCGCKAVLTNVRMSDHSFKAGCYNETCWRPGTDVFDSERSAVEAWNTRATTPLPALSKLAHHRAVLRRALNNIKYEIQTRIHADGKDLALSYIEEALEETAL